MLSNGEIEKKTWTKEKQEKNSAQGKNKDTLRDWKSALDATNHLNARESRGSFGQIEVCSSRPARAKWQEQLLVQLDVCFASFHIFPWPFFALLSLCFWCNKNTPFIASHFHLVRHGMMQKWWVEIKLSRRRRKKQEKINSIGNSFFLALIKQHEQIILTLQVHKSYFWPIETSILKILVAQFQIWAGIKFHDANEVKHLHEVRPEIHIRPV